MVKTESSARSKHASLVMSGVSHSFGTRTVLSDLDIEVQPGEFVVLVGPSGCGKTTLLNLLSGHIAPSAGKVSRVGVVRTVYQSDGLFPWLTVSENILMGLRKVRPDAEKGRQLDELL